MGQGRGNREGGGPGRLDAAAPRASRASGGLGDKVRVNRGVQRVTTILDDLTISSSWSGPFSWTARIAFSNSFLARKLLFLPPTVCPPCCQLLGCRSSSFSPYSPPRDGPRRFAQPALSSTCRWATARYAWMARAMCIVRAFVSTLTAPIVSVSLPRPWCRRRSS